MPSQYTLHIERKEDKGGRERDQEENKKEGIKQGKRKEKVEKEGGKEKNKGKVLPLSSWLIMGKKINLPGCQFLFTCKM